MKALILIPLVLMVTACKWATIPDKDESVNIDKRLLEPCTEVSELKSGKDVDNLEFTKTVLSNLTQCSLRHKNLAAEVRKGYNIKD